MAEAAKSARGAFTDIKTGSGEMGREVGGNMMEARHGVMLLGEEFGIHLPRALTTFIASIGPIGAAMEAAFPFLAVAVGATLLIEALVKMHEAGEKLTSDQMKFGTAVQNAFNSLDQKILQAGIHADELRNDHLGALKKQLELIDKQSMAELAHSFEEVAKSADVVFADLKSHWYTFGIGSGGAKHALDEFQNKYDSLLAQGKDREASDLLKGTRDSAQKVLDLQNQAASNKPKSGTGSDEAWAANLKYGEAMQALKASGVGITEEEVQAQQALVDTLNAQVNIEGKIATLKRTEDSNANRSTSGAMSAESSAAARAAAESQQRISEQSLAAQRAVADAQLTITRASIQTRLQSEIAFADRELQIQLQGNQAMIGALDKYAKDYPNQLKALHEKAEELEQQHATKVAELTSKAQVEQNNKDLQTLEEGIREQIEATQQGTAARLAAIDAAIKTEQSRNMQDLSAFRDLQAQRVTTVREMAEEEAKLRADAGREAADNETKMGELSIAAARQHQQLMDSTHRMSMQARIAEDIEFANQEYALKLTAASLELAALDKEGKDYENKLRAIQDKQKQLIQQHENEITAIKEKAEQDRNNTILSAEQRATSEIATGLTQSIMGHQTWAHMIDSFAEQAASGLIRNSLMIMMQQDKERLSNARKAATSAYATGESMGGPAGIVLGPVFAAAAFAGAMAFEDGGVVPGVGRGDIVPAMLTPGEGVVPGGVMDQLATMARSGNMGGSKHLHSHMQVHIHASALDADGMDKVLKKHEGKIQKHVENSLRKLNR
jgi:hypothetical protein